MKNFYRQNHYELLEVRPDADLEEITEAYHQALEAFNRDSVAVYTLFEDQEREMLLEMVKAAYLTLSSRRSRKEYDRQLLSRGELSPEETVFFRPDRESELETGDHEPLARRVRQVHQPLEPIVKEEGEPLEVDPEAVLVGRDLKRLRQSRGVSLQEISERTKIGIDTIQAVEADLHHRLPAKVYVKGFLRAYAQALMVDGEALSRAYLAGMDT